ncbi:MAG: PEGA domain-containing protein [Planctomycetes bacterium]|nr:PEGA domain-containing protein [Planctomycetota bacterium]
MSRTTKISGVALCLLASTGVLAVLAQTADKAPTELYVRTDPAGATITVDGKQQGTSPKLFEVEPGDHTVVVKVPGHQPKTKEVAVRDGRIKRVVLRFPEEPDDPKGTSFGPVLERVVNDHSVGEDYLIDLDTGKLYTRPAKLRLIEEMHAWARKQGIDASGVQAGEGALTGFEIRAAIVDDASWEKVTPQAVREALKQPDPRLVVRQGDAPALICLGGEGVSPERVYAIETREGGVGVLQLVGPGDKDHRSVKIRYKLISGTAASPPAGQVWTCAMHPQVNVPKPGKCPLCAMDLVARPPQQAKDDPRASKTIFLPDAHTPGVGGVLDLASGEILAISGEKGFFAVREFARQHHKGDLYYGYDEEDGGAFIGCLRGATAVIRDGGPARPLEPSQKREDVTVYLLPPLPCRLLITTAEKKIFDVTILSAGKSGEGDMGIPRNISGIRLRYELADPEVVPEAKPADSLTDTSVEQKVRDVIAKFAAAVVKGNKAAVTECLHPKKYGMVDRLDEAAESVSAGLKLGEVRSVFVRGDRVLVATELATINDPKSAASVCTVYTLVKIGKSWVIEDIDMEDEKGRADEIRRFKNETLNEAEGSREQAEMLRRPANAKATSAGRLGLRIAATRGDVGEVTLEEKDVENYINDLKTNGPEAARRRGDPFAWFPMNGKPRPPLITADHGGQTFVLLANTPEHTMLRGSTRPWGIASVTVHHELQGRPAVSVELDEAGGRQLGKLTETHLNLPLAILIDDRVLSAPTVRTKITTRFQISGSFDIEEAGRLAQTMMSAVAPSEPVDDPSAGFESTEPTPIPDAKRERNGGTPRGRPVPRPAEHRMGVDRFRLSTVGQDREGD